MFNSTLTELGTRYNLKIKQYITEKTENLSLLKISKMGVCEGRNYQYLHLNELLTLLQPPHVSVK